MAASTRWQAVPLVPQAVLDAGIAPGGEGGQWPQAIGIDPVDGKFLLYGTGRLYKSADGGKTWAEVANSQSLGGGIVKAGPDGGREAIAIRVHPKTRYAYVSTGCYGFWKFGPPAAKKAQ